MGAVALIGAVVCATALIWGAAACAAASPGATTEPSYEILEVFLSEEEAARQLFPTAETLRRESVALTEEQVGAVGRVAGHPWTGPTEPTVYIAESGAERLGYAVVMDEIGKHHFITFMVGVTEGGRVQAVEVLVYRESRGGEVRRRRFLRQFRGKGLDDPIAGGRDIVNITGATLSVNAVSRGVRKALALVEVLYGTVAQFEKP